MDDILLWLLVSAGIVVEVGAALHAIMYKRDARTAASWTAFILFAPLVGAFLYLVFGINRIRREFRARRQHTRHAEAGGSRHVVVSDVEAAWRTGSPQIAQLARFTGQVVPRYPLLGGNSVTLLEDGDQAYPLMLEAIAGAEHTVGLCTYIFDHDPAGERFLAALKAAVERGVEVRVLIDDVGSRYSRPRMPRLLRRAGVPVATFMRALVPWRLPYWNLRNHRKVLTVDGRVAFTGGLNIRHGHVVGEDPRHPIRDVHARLEGPIVAQLQYVFTEDWEFTTGERVAGPGWFPELGPSGRVAARALPSGPDDDDLENIRMALLAAVNTARHRVRIVTPYFLPDQTLITALNVAAMRGVEVDVVLPANNNQLLVKWACQSLWWQLLIRGCRLWLSPGVFDHGKLMVVDGVWTLIGSANWDPRSLRLNFELNVEAYDRGLAARVDAMIQARLDQAERITLARADGRPLHIRLRDGFARLFIGAL